MTTQKIIELLDLQPHPEGGYYRETYRTIETVSSSVLEQERNLSTSIYYLMVEDDHSNFHRVKSDEMWYYHQGETVEILMIQNKCLRIEYLGNTIERCEQPQILVPANTWFAAGIRGKEGYALVSCSVSPGFDFRDFEMGNRAQLINEFPYLRNDIIRYTK